MNRLLLKELAEESHHVWNSFFGYLGASVCYSCVEYKIPVFVVGVSNPELDQFKIDVNGSFILIVFDCVLNQVEY